MRSPPRRVVVLGASGSGKSTLAAALAGRLALPYHATDPVFWAAGWRATPEAAVRAWLVETTAAPSWVLDGNFVSHRDVLWARADLAVWLDLPFTTCVWRVARRNLRWWATRERVWGAGRMTLRRALDGTRHAWQAHARKRRTYPTLLTEARGLTVVRLTSQGEVDRWLRTLPAMASGNEVAEPQ